MGNTVINLHSRERMAWGFVLASFTVFVLILIAIPISIGAYIQRATESLSIQVEANQGAVTMNTGQGMQQRAVLPGDLPGRFEAGTSLRTGFPGNAFLYVTLPDQEEVLARLQVGANTTLLVEQGDTPRFEASDGENEFVGSLLTGQLQIRLLEGGERPLQFAIHTPHGHVELLAPGEYELEATSGSTQIIARTGRATIIVGEETVVLLPEQRAYVTAEQRILGPLTPQLNLIPNGDFSQPLVSENAAWQYDPWNIELIDQPLGQMRQILSDGQSWLRLTRQGQGHADIRFHQTLDQLVDDDSPLWLQIKFRIISHSLEVCGFQGSECPLLLQMHYEDGNGNPHDWMQGFYVVGGMGDTAPYACFSCGVLHTNHEQVVPNEVTLFEIEMAEIDRLGPRPHIIKNIGFVISGHSFDVEIIDVALFKTSNQ